MTPLVRRGGAALDPAGPPAEPGDFPIPDAGGAGAGDRGHSRPDRHGEALPGTDPLPDRAIIADPERDLLKLAVLERHRRSGRIGLGLVKGLGLREGAVASSVAHDSHNLIVAGVE